MGEITTILSGSRGAPTITVREPNWRGQAEAERGAQRRAGAKAEGARVERGADGREPASRPPLVPQEPGARGYADAKRQQWLDECAEKGKWTPERVTAMLDAEETLLLAMRAQMPDPPPQPARYGRPLSPAEQAYEAAQLDAFLA